VSTGIKTSIEVHHGEIENRNLRSAVIALLFSVAIHLGALLAIGPGFIGNSILQPGQPLNSLAHEFVSVNANLVRKSPGQPLVTKTDDIQSHLKIDGSEVPSSEKIASRNETVYLLGSEIDVPAEPISRPNIVYPEQAMLSRLAGRVRIRIFIDFEGRVNSLETLESQPHYPPFEEIALNALMETRFKPATRFGQPVNSQKIVEVLFNPYEDSTSGP
jgi:TonB family protein